MLQKPFRVVIVGGGFGGLAAAEALANSNTQVTLVDRHNSHVFQPLLYQVATGTLSPENVALPLRDAVAAYKNVQVVMAEVQGFDLDKKEVMLSEGHLPYDALIMAAGMATSYFGNEAWQLHAPGLKNLEDALTIRRRVMWALENASRCDDPQQRQALLTFAVVGGGPTGVEVAGALCNLLADMAAGFRNIDLGAATVILVESGSRVLPPYAQQLSYKAAEALKNLGVVLKLNTRVIDVSAAGITLNDVAGQSFMPARTIVWAAGMQAPPVARALAHQTGAIQDRHGRIAVGDDMSIAGHPDVFVVGDLAHRVAAHGDILPAVAPMALQSGRYVGDTLLARLAGRATPSFVYKDLGSMAVIGRGNAIVQIGKLKMAGVLAFLTWLAVHLAGLRGGLRRLLVALQWATSFMVGRPAARAVIAVGQPAQGGVWQAEPSSLAASSGESLLTGLPSSP